MGLELEIRNVLLCTVQVLLLAQVASFVTCEIVQDAIKYKLLLELV